MTYLCIVFITVPPPPPPIQPPPVPIVSTRYAPLTRIDPCTTTSTAWIQSSIEGSKRELGEGDSRCTHSFTSYHSNDNNFLLLHHQLVLSLRYTRISVSVYCMMYIPCSRTKSTIGEWDEHDSTGRRHHSNTASSCQSDNSACEWTFEARRSQGVVGGEGILTEVRIQGDRLEYCIQSDRITTRDGWGDTVLIIQTEPATGMWSWWGIPFIQSTISAKEEEWSEYTIIFIYIYTVCNPFGWWTTCYYASTTSTYRRCEWRDERRARICSKQIDR